MASVAGLALDIFQIAIDLLQIYTSLPVEEIFQAFVKLKHDYGLLRAFILIFIFADAQEFLGQIENNVLQSTGEEPMMIKKVLMDDCTMLAVAGAIFSQIAITALSLDNLSSVHWVGKASFIISLVTGSLSAFYACLLQQHISGLWGPGDVKSWLSQPADEKELKYLHAEILPSLRRIHLATGGLPNGEQEAHARSKIEDTARAVARQWRWKKASFNAALMIKIPPLLLSCSVGSFLMGLGIYLGYLWTRNLDIPRPQSESKSILIVYIVITIVGLLLFFVPRNMKYQESAPIRRWVEMLDPEDDSLRHTLEEIFKASSTEKYVGHIPKSRNADQAEPAHTPKRPTAIVSEIYPTPEPSTPMDVEKAWAGEPAKLNAVDIHGYGGEENPDSQPGVAGKKTCEVEAIKDPLLAALEASIRAQEEATATLRRLFEEYQRGVIRT